MDENKEEFQAVENPLLLYGLINNKMSLHNLSHIYSQVGEYYTENELTSDQEYELFISLQGDLEEKVKNYLHVIETAEANADSCDKEIKRLQDRKKSNKKLAERLKKVLVEVTEANGDLNKSGNSILEFSTLKLATRANKSIVFDDDYYNAVVKLFIDYVVKTDYISAFTIDDLLADINENIAAKYKEITERELPDGLPPVTRTLLEYIKISKVQEISLYNYYNYLERDLDISYKELIHKGVNTHKISKTELKSVITIDGQAPLATEVTNKTLNVK